MNDKPSGQKLSQEQLKAALAETDAELARVVEDLIGILVDKQILMFTDLPPIVQEKMNRRELLRQQLRDVQPRLLSDSEDF